MAAWRAELTTLEQVVSFYENSPLIKYKVFAGNKPDINCLRWEYDGDNKNEGLHELENACNAILANPANINSYTLQLLRSNKTIKLGEHKAAKTIQDAINIVFQLNFDYNRQMQPMQMGALNNDSVLVKVLQQQTEQLNALTSMLTAKLGANSDVDVDDAEDEPISVGAIGERLLEPVLSVFESPILQTALAEKISGWLLPNKVPAAIAGVTQDENEKLIQQAITILKQHDNNLGADLMKLAEIAQRDINQFNTLLMVLRSQ